jgi:hypothetical protein
MATARRPSLPFVFAGAPAPAARSPPSPLAPVFAPREYGTPPPSPYHAGASAAASAYDLSPRGRRAGVTPWASAADLGTWHVNESHIFAEEDDVAADDGGAPVFTDPWKTDGDKKFK